MQTVLTPTHFTLTPALHLHCHNVHCKSSQYDYERCQLDPKNNNTDFVNSSANHSSASNRVCSLEYDVGILAFSSDSSVRESGFRAALAPSGVRDDPRSAFHFNEPEVVLNYPVGGGTYQNYDRVSMVFQQNGPNYLEITRLETESGYDIISAYTIYAHYTRSAPQLDGR